MIPRARRRDWSLKHCQQRAAQRYGISLSERLYDELCRNLAERPPHPYAFSPSGLPVYVLEVCGRTCKLTFDPQSALLLTFLPSHAYERHLRDSHAIHRDQKRWKRKRTRNAGRIHFNTE